MNKIILKFLIWLFGEAPEEKVIIGDFGCRENE